MKTFTLLLLSVLLCPAQLSIRQPFYGAILKASAASLLIDETFEGTGAPTGWANVAGASNFDNTSSPIAGAQDLMMDINATGVVTNGFTASGEVWLQCEIKTNGDPTGGQPGFIYLYNTALTAYGVVTMNGSGQIRVGDVAGDGSSTVDSVAPNTRYWLFVHMKKGTGANATYDLEFSTTSTRTGSGNKFTNFTTGSMTDNFQLLYLNRVDATWGAFLTFQIDNVKASNVGWP